MGASNLIGQIREFRWRRQGLDGGLAKARAAQILETTGWMRSVGGAAPYLGLFARGGLSREEIDRDAAALHIHELPAARGCTYVLPASDFAFALRAGQGFSSDVATAKKFFDVTDAEIGKLGSRIVDAVKQPKDPRELKEELGGAVRNLGEAGKKRGMTTTLPIALGLLQARGEIRRVPVGGRLDQQRYAYVRWGLKIPDLSEEQVAIELARRYFRWAAPASAAQFQWWSGLGARVARAAVAELKLSALDGDELAFADDADALRSMKPAKEPRVALVSSLDNLFHLRRDLESLTEAADLKRIPREGRTDNTLMDLSSHAIAQGGRLVGLWEYDAEKEHIVAGVFGKQIPAIQKAIAAMEAFVRDQLGDAPQFSLDSPESRRDRLAALRKI
jgi:winged helix DNA-binding protein